MKSDEEIQEGLQVVGKTASLGLTVEIETSHGKVWERYDDETRYTVPEDFTQEERYRTHELVNLEIRANLKAQVSASAKKRAEKAAERSEG